MPIEQCRNWTIRQIAFFHAELNDSAFGQLDIAPECGVDLSESKASEHVSAERTPPLLKRRDERFRVEVSATRARSSAKDSPFRQAVRRTRAVLEHAMVTVDGNKIVAMGPDEGKYPKDCGRSPYTTHIIYYWDRSPGSNPRKKGRRHPAVSVMLAEDNARPNPRGVDGIRKMVEKRLRRAAM